MKLDLSIRHLRFLLKDTSLSKPWQPQWISWSLDYAFPQLCLLCWKGPEWAFVVLINGSLIPSLPQTTREWITQQPPAECSNFPKPGRLFQNHLPSSIPLPAVSLSSSSPLLPLPLGEQKADLPIWSLMSPIFQGCFLLNNFESIGLAFPTFQSSHGFWSAAKEINQLYWVRSKRGVNNWQASPSGYQVQGSKRPIMALQRKVGFEGGRSLMWLQAAIFFFPPLWPFLLHLIFETECSSLLFSPHAFTIATPIPISG